MRAATTQFKIRYTKPRTFVQLVVPMGRGKFTTYTAVVDNMKIARHLADAGVDFQISGLFGKIWKSVKKVAKKTGISKVIKLARKALPLASKFLPPPLNMAAAGASMALETASDLVKAKKARKRGGRKGRALQARYIQRALKRGKRYGKIAGKRRRRKSMKSGRRLYKIMVTPA